MKTTNWLSDQIDLTVGIAEPERGDSPFPAMVLTFRLVLPDGNEIRTRKPIPIDDYILELAVPPKPERMTVETLDDPSTDPTG